MSHTWLVPDTRNQYIVCSITARSFQVDRGNNSRSSQRLSEKVSHIPKDLLKFPSPLQIKIEKRHLVWVRKSWTHFSGPYKSQTKPYKKCTTSLTNNLLPYPVAYPIPSSSLPTTCVFHIVYNGPSEPWQWSGTLTSNQRESIRTQICSLISRHVQYTECTCTVHYSTQCSIPPV